MSVTELGNRLSQQYFLSMLKDQLNETQRQSSSGKKSQTIAGLGTLGASHSISYRTQNKLLDNYTGNLNLAKTRFDVMDKAVTSITDSARDVMTHLRTLLQDVSPRAAITADTAKVALDSVTQKLNTQLDGRYLFSGDDIHTAPVANRAALDSTAATQLTAALGNPATTVNSIIATARGASGTALGYSAGVGTSGNVAFRAGDDLDIDFTQKADQAGYADIMRGLSIVSNLPQPTTPTEQANYWDAVNAAIKLIDEGTKAVDSYQGVMGNRASEVEKLLSEHSEMQATLEQYIGDVEDVDMVEAATRLEALKVQTETSYSLIASMRDLSLIKYI